MPVVGNFLNKTASKTGTTRCATRIQAGSDPANSSPNLIGLASSKGSLSSLEVKANLVLVFILKIGITTIEYLPHLLMAPRQVAMVGPRNNHHAPHHPPMVRRQGGRSK